jgi:hypothetical protein
MPRVSLLFAIVLCAASVQYRAGNVDASVTRGTIRSFQAVDGGPIPVLPNGPDLSSRY